MHPSGCFSNTQIRIHSSAGKSGRLISGRSRVRILLYPDRKKMIDWKVVSRMAKGKYQEWLEPEGLLKLEGWARDGLTDEQIAENIGIRRETLYDWCKRHPNISNALKKGKEVVDRQVENALLKRALGYKYDEVTIEDGVETKRVTKEVVPDTTAQIFWLKNRKPYVWRDKKDVGLAGELNTNNPFADLTTEELKKLVRDG